MLASSKEYVRATVSATGVATATLTTYDCYMAVIAQDATLNTSTDFHAATWAAVDDPTVVLLIGPGAASGITLTEGTEYNVYVKIDGGGQTPILLVGTIPSKATWTYTGDPSNSDRDMVRFLIGDTDSTDQQILDAEIDALLTLYGDSRSTAIQACRTLSAKYTRNVSKTVGPISISYGERANAYNLLADNLERGLNIAAATLAAPYLSGASVNDKSIDQLDTDVIKVFGVGIHDDLKDLSVAGTNEDTFERIL